LHPDLRQFPRDRECILEELDPVADFIEQEVLNEIDPSHEEVLVDGGCISRVSRTDHLRRPASGMGDSQPGLRLASRFVGIAAARSGRRK
jgi:hypothetical protein